MLSPETLAARPAKDAKFAHMVAPTGQGARAGKPAGRKLINPEKVIGMLPRRSLWRSCRIALPRWRGGGTNMNVATEEIVEGTKRMAISGACACVGVTTGAA